MCYTIKVGLPLLRPRSGDNLTSLFWDNGSVQIDCRCVNGPTVGAISTAYVLIKL